jgi:hypothetical protein
VLVTDAVDVGAKRFYGHFGLASVDDRFPCRMVLDLHPLLPGK